MTSSTTKRLTRAAVCAAPRSNLTGDPFFTNGLRAVLFFEARPRTLDEVQYVDWERPPRFAQYEDLVQH